MLRAPVTVNTDAAYRTGMRNPRWWVLFLGLAGAGLALFAVAWSWLGIPAAVLAGAAAVIEWQNPPSRTFEIPADRWEAIDASTEGRQYVIPAREVGPGRNVSTRIPLDDGGSEEVILDVWWTASGDLQLRVGTPLAIVVTVTG